MIQNIGINTYNPNIGVNTRKIKATNKHSFKGALSLGTPLSNPVYNKNSINTKLSQEESKKYTYLVDFLKKVPVSPNAEKLTCAKQLDLLLKNGKLLSKSSNDRSTTLDNLYDIATTPRADGLDAKKVLSNTLDLLVNPRYVTQTFGDIPAQKVANILSKQKPDSEVLKDTSKMNVQASGTCAAASNEVNLANKYPAEFARWVSALSSSQKALYLDVRLDSISKNKLDALTILNLLQANIVNFGFESSKIKITPDENAYLRAQIQAEHWDKGERNIADVLVQSAIMQLGSQNTYDALTDTRGGNFNSNPQGLIEIEKTFVESIAKNHEVTSLVYQKIDDNQNLLGYNCSFETMQKHIMDTIDLGDNVIIGYVLTNETAGRTTNPSYNAAVDGAPNKVINGHEITIVDYIKDDKGNVSFICIDTDDDSPDYVKYSADWLLPKLHHAGYPAHVVAQDEEAITKEANSIA